MWQHVVSHIVLCGLYKSYYFFFTTRGVRMIILSQFNINLTTRETLLNIFSHNNELCLHV